MPEVADVLTNKTLVPYNGELSVGFNSPVSDSYDTLIPNPGQKRGYLEATINFAGNVYTVSMVPEHFSGAGFGYACQKET